MKSKKIIEGLSDDAHSVDRDHEVQMARAQLYNLAGDAIALYKSLKHVSEEQGLEGWVQSKITLAQDYISDIRNWMDAQQQDQELLTVTRVAPFESTTAGGIAAVSAPLGQKKKPIRR